MQGLFRGQKSFCSKFLINLIFVIAKYYFGEVWYYEKNVSQIYVRMKISVWVFCLFIFLNGWTDPVLNCVWYLTWPKLRCVRVLLICLIKNVDFYEFWKSINLNRKIRENFSFCLECESLFMNKVAKFGYSVLVVICLFVSNWRETD